LRFREHYKNTKFADIGEKDILKRCVVGFDMRNGIFKFLYKIPIHCVSNVDNINDMLKLKVNLQARNVYKIKPNHYSTLGFIRSNKLFTRHYTSSGSRVRAYFTRPKRRQSVVGLVFRYVGYTGKIIGTLILYKWGEFFRILDGKYWTFQKKGPRAAARILRKMTFYQNGYNKHYIVHVKNRRLHKKMEELTRKFFGLTTTEYRKVYKQQKQGHYVGHSACTADYIVGKSHAFYRKKLKNRPWEMRVSKNLYSHILLLEDVFRRRCMVEEFHHLDTEYGKGNIGLARNSVILLNDGKEYLKLTKEK
jgi:hypothetical protein